MSKKKIKIQFLEFELRNAHLIAAVEMIISEVIRTVNVNVRFKARKISRAKA